MVDCAAAVGRRQTHQVGISTAASGLVRRSLSELRWQMHHLCVTEGALWHCVDADSSAAVTPTEFATGLAQVGLKPPPTEEEAVMLFHYVDSNSDGSVSWQGVRIHSLHCTVVLLLV